MSADPRYDAAYYQVGCGELPYERNEGWLKFFAGIADRIVERIQPRLVLDAGCALGFLVEALRDRDVEAFGVDISSYAIGQVREDVRPFCWVGSIADPLPRSYDLIVCIEVLEHMPRAEAERAVENFARHTDDVLFSSTPIDYKEPSHINLQPQDYWVELFAFYGYVRDLEFDASFIAPWAMRFRRARDPWPRLVRGYERRLALIEQENRELRASALNMRQQLAGLVTEADRYRAQQAEVERLRALVRDYEASITGRTLRALDTAARYLAPRNTLRGHIFDALLAGLRRQFDRAERLAQAAAEEGIGTALARRLPGSRRRLERRSIRPAPPLVPSSATVDVILAVHNALEAVRDCLQAVVRHTRAPHRLILVDDGSDEDTARFLAEFAREQGATLIRNDTAQGYTRAINIALEQSTGDYVLLLNSDTIVTPDWLDRLIACAESDPHIGLVGPLSNTASWQSIPQVFDAAGDWAANPLPPDLSPADFAYLLGQYSPRIYPRLPFLNGFCLLIKRAVIQSVGLLDADNFAEGYGEENDYCLRARAKGWQLAVADDAYVYHAQSQSYSHERRKQLSERGQERLAAKHGLTIIGRGVEAVRHDRVLEGIRVRSQVMLAREQMRAAGRKRWEGKRLLCLLPVRGAGGGANVILQEAEAARQMGVDVTVINLAALRQVFERGYPDLSLPVRYVDGPEEISVLAARYDAVIATQNMSVEWMDWPEWLSRRPVRGYYVQDYEPWFFPAGSEDHVRATRSYALFPDLVRVTKTEWTRATVQQHAGVDCTVVGPSVDIDLYRPRPRCDGSWPERRLRIAAMIRPDSPRRQPRLTMEVLREVDRRHGGEVDIVLFGCATDHPGFRALPRNFRWQNLGTLNRSQVAFLLNEVDIFVDLSSFQAMGLTALEAMACGAAVIVPQTGGAESFARPGSNCLVADTTTVVTAHRTLETLVTDHELRLQLQRQAMSDSVQYYPERAVTAVLAALFPEGTA